MQSDIDSLLLFEGPNIKTLPLIREYDFFFVALTPSRKIVKKSWFLLFSGIDPKVEVIFFFALAQLSHNRLSLVGGLNQQEERRSIINKDVT